jgi:hypothetical protein
MAIGVLAAFAYLSSVPSGRNYPLGVTHGVMHAELLITEFPLKHVYASGPRQSSPARETQAERRTKKSPGGLFWKSASLCWGHS